MTPESPQSRSALPADYSFCDGLRATRCIPHNAHNPPAPRVVEQLYAVDAMLKWVTSRVAKRFIRTQDVSYFSERPAIATRLTLPKVLNREDRRHAFDVLFGTENANASLFTGGVYNRHQACTWRI